MTLIATIQIPDVAIAVARRDDPTLADSPMLLYRPGPRASVYAASADTGVPAGMPLRQALLRAPRAVCRPAIPERDQAAVTALARLLQSFSPRVVTEAILPN